MSNRLSANGTLLSDFHQTIYEAQGNVFIRNDRNIKETFVITAVSDIQSENQTTDILDCGFEEITVVGDKEYRIYKTKAQMLLLDVADWFQTSDSKCGVESWEMVVNPIFPEGTAENITLAGNFLSIGSTNEDSAVKVTATSKGSITTTRDIYVNVTGESQFKTSVPMFEKNPED
jgi:hypothetical protein